MAKDACLSKMPTTATNRSTSADGQMVNVPIISELAKKSAQPLHSQETVFRCHFFVRCPRILCHYFPILSSTRRLLCAARIPLPSSRNRICFKLNHFRHGHPFVSHTFYMPPRLSFYSSAIRAPHTVPSTLETHLRLLVSFFNEACCCYRPTTKLMQPLLVSRIFSPHTVPLPSCTSVFLHEFP